MSDFFLSQILIGIAFVVDLASFQFKKRELTILCFSISSFLIAAHFFLLGATTGGAVTTVSGIRHFSSIFTTDARVKYAWLVVIACLGAYTFDGIEDVFSILAGTFGTFAVFQRDPRRLRILSGLGTSSIIVHNVMIWTPMGIALEVFFLGSNIVSYYRFYRSAR